jgi:hypothetical protein
MKFAILTLSSFLILAAARAQTTRDLSPRRTEEILIPVSTETDLNLRIENNFGPVNLIEGAGPELKITAYNPSRRGTRLHHQFDGPAGLRIWTGPRSNVRTTNTIDPDEIRARAEFKLRESERLYGETQAHLLIEVPSHLLGNVRITSSRGGVSITGYFAAHDRARGRTIDIRTDLDGAVACVGVCGTLSIQTQAGGVRLERVIGDVVVRTVGGVIVHQGGVGNAELHTRSGAIDARDNAGDMKARTLYGDIEVRGQTEGTVDVESTTGAVFLMNPLARDETWAVPSSRSWRTRLRLVHDTARTAEPLRNLCLSALIGRLGER